MKAMLQSLENKRDDNALFVDKAKWTELDKIGIDLALSALD